MIIHRIEEFKRGWLIGNFEPSLLRTEEFEVAVLIHEAGKNHPTHFHKIATEYNMVISGEMSVNGHLLVPGDVFIIQPWELSETEFFTDCKVLCVKVPSVPGDKYEVMMTPPSGIQLTPEQKLKYRSARAASELKSELDRMI